MTCNKARLTARDIVVLALCATILFVQQVAKATFLWFLPNVELVSILVIVFTLTFGRRVLYIIYTFVLLEGLFYGFNPLWWVPYLYLWTILAALVWVFRANRSVIVWAVLSGVFGLCFGALSSIPYFVTGGWAAGVAYWVSGIPFDAIHCAGNFIVCLALWKPLMRVMRLVEKKEV